MYGCTSNHIEDAPQTEKPAKAKASSLVDPRQRESGYENKVPTLASLSALLGWLGPGLQMYDWTM